MHHAAKGNVGVEEVVAGMGWVVTKEVSEVVEAWGEIDAVE